jgi:hypothetical protein
MRVKNLESLIWGMGAVMMAASGIILGNAGMNNSSTQAQTYQQSAPHYTSALKAYPKIKIFKARGARAARLI